MFKPAVAVPERFRADHAVVTDANVARSLRFGAKTWRRPMPIRALAGLAVVLKRLFAALHEAQMRQAAREMYRYRDLIADDWTAADFAFRCCDRVARSADQEISQPRSISAAIGGTAHQLTAKD